MPVDPAHDPSNKPDPKRKRVTIETPSAGAHKSWLRHEHPFYTANKAKWLYVRDHYNGEVIDSKKISTYLIRRATGETDDAYAERCKLADYTNHFAEAAEGLVGMVFAVEGDANRVFLDQEGRGLGKVDDPSTPIGRLWQRADPDGNSYLTVYKQLLMYLTLYQFGWVMVDPADGESQVRVIEPLSVPNWSPDGREVLILESADTRTSLADAPAMGDRFLHVFPAGWQRYTEDKSGNPVKLTGPNDSGRWHFESQTGKPRVPVFNCAVPMKRMIGYQQAKKANVIFNKESVRDFGQRTAGFQKLVLSAGNQLYDKLEAALAEGSNLLQEDPAADGGGHRYIGPDPAPATALTETIKLNVADFRSNFHRAYDDSAQQKTATEVRQDVGSGTGAFLQLLVAALDDAENNALPLLEQAEYPGDRARWFIARVQRTTDFVPVDIDAVQEKSATAAFGAGKPVPMGVSARISLAREIAESRGANVDPDELSAHVRVQLMIELLESAPTAGLEIPADVKAELVMLSIMAAGLIPKDATEQMEDGTKKPKLELIRAEVVKLLKAADEQKKRDAEMLAGGNPKNQNDDGDPVPPGDV